MERSPSIDECGRGLFFVEPGYNLLWIAADNVCLTSDDFPDPETPVTQTHFPSGISHVSFFKLLPEASFSIIFLPFPTRLLLECVIFFFCDKY